MSGNQARVPGGDDVERDALEQLARRVRCTAPARTRASPLASISGRSSGRPPARSPSSIPPRRHLAEQEHIASGVLIRTNLPGLGIEEAAFGRVVGDEIPIDLGLGPRPMPELGIDRPTVAPDRDRRRDADQGQGECEPDEHGQQIAHAMSSSTTRMFPSIHTD